MFFTAASLRRSFLSLGVFLSGQIALAPAAGADEFVDASRAMCEKVKSCAVAKMGDTKNMSAEMKAMVMQSLDSMCTQMDQNFSAVARYHELYAPATACMRSMARLSCEEYDSANEKLTEECAAYEQAAAKYR